MSMFGVSGRPKVPVVPGPDPVPGGCAACGTDRGTMVREVHEGHDLSLCFDFRECAARYRRGASASSYAAGLRGEPLGVL